MADVKSRWGWLNAMLAGLGGLFSGAAVVFVTPVVDYAVKPAKPLANFRFERDGLTIRFENLGQNVAQGWWDFGDGSPLMPLSSDSPTVSHAYSRPGEYSVRLLVTNRIGDENERSVVVKLDAPAVAEAPQIVSLEAIPLSPGSYAPASYRLLSSVKNAQVCVWDLGMDRPLEVVTDPATSNPIVTFPRSGGYVVKLAAVNGTQYDERTEIITVMEPPYGTLSATVSVTDRGVRRETRNQAATFGVPYPAERRDPAFKFDRQTLAPTGHRIRDVKIAPPGVSPIHLGERTALDLDPAVLGLKSSRNLRLNLTADRSAVQLTGELLRSGNKLDPLPSLVLPMVLILEREKTIEKPTVQVAAALTLPTPAAPQSQRLQLPPVPTDWSKATRHLQVELRDGKKLLWKGSNPPIAAALTLGDRKYAVTITSVEGQLQIDLRDITGRTASLP